ncbi:hypothetical protein CcaCcLH18_11981 [Colletotrichum camelliae]|nr:hypothetical protein CcaCcLH18_11981 [Colletotrichum camelliae]
MAAPSLNHWKVADALEDQFVIQVRIPDPLIFNTTSKETPQGWLCRIHGFESCDSSEESSSTPGPEIRPTSGILLFSGPKNLHEKLRANIPNSFLASRQKTLNDLVFGPKFGQAVCYSRIVDPAEPDLGSCSGKAGDLGRALARDTK